MKPYRVVEGLLDMLEATKSKSAKSYISPTLVVKATLHGKWSNRSPQRTVHVTFGKPNYDERAFIKKVQKVGAQFPIKKIQLKPEVKRCVTN
jgi:hypothetical protein